MPTDNHPLVSFINSANTEFVFSDPNLGKILENEGFNVWENINDKEFHASIPEPFQARGFGKSRKNRDFVKEVIYSDRAFWKEVKKHPESYSEEMNVNAYLNRDSEGRPISLGRVEF